MASTIRYRTGIDRRTGQVITGWAHVCQSLEVIWLTEKNTRVMRLDFGAELHKRLGEDIAPALVVQLYADLVTATVAWEPEYRIKELQLVQVAQDGSLGLKHSGIYYPEGRFGNYRIAIAAGDVVRRMAARLGGA